MESWICLGSETPGDCFQNIPQDSFVRHVSRHFHGDLDMRLGKGNIFGVNILNQ